MFEQQMRFELTFTLILAIFCWYYKFFFNRIWLATAHRNESGIALDIHDAGETTSANHSRHLVENPKTITFSLKNNVKWMYFQNLLTPNAKIIRSRKDVKSFNLIFSQNQFRSFSTETDNLLLWHFEFKIGHNLIEKCFFSILKNSVWATNTLKT